jgi:hypothetical protein
MAAQNKIMVSVKMLSGDLFSIECPLDITVKQFYQAVWQTIPQKIALQCLDLFRQDQDAPLHPDDSPLHPIEDELFSLFIQTSHYTIQLELVADAYDGSSHYEVFDIAIHEGHHDMEESKNNPPSICHFPLPTDQTGQRVQSNHRYTDTHRTLYVKREENAPVAFYCDPRIRNICRHGRIGDEWTIEVPEDVLPLPNLPSLLNNLSISPHPLHILQLSLQQEWDQYGKMAQGGWSDEPIQVEPTQYQDYYRQDDEQQDDYEDDEQDNWA